MIAEPILTHCARLLLAAALLLVAPPAFAQNARPADATTYTLNKDRSQIRFSIGHFMVSSTEGRFTAFDGKLAFEPGAPERGTVIIHVQTGSIDTGIAARDDHLRTADFFDAAKYPVTTFESTDLTRLTPKTGTLSGNFSLHGATRPLTLDAALETPDLAADRLAFTATAKLKRSDYGMTQYQGVIGDEVTLTIRAEFDRLH